MVPESTRAASTHRQRESRNYRRARVAIDRARCAGGHCLVHNLAVADVDHELSRATASQARIIASLEMLISFSVCGFGIMLFHALISARPAQSSTVSAGVRTIGRRRFLALAIGATLFIALSGVLRRLYRIGTFAYDGQQTAVPACKRSRRFAHVMNFIKSQKISSTR